MSRRILVVDDNEAHCLWSVEILEPHGYQVDTSNCPDKALGMVKNKDYDLIISDLYMPGMNGSEFLKKVSEIKKGQKAIILTGDGDVNTFIESVYDIGALEYIVKPIEVDHFVAMVDKLISGGAGENAMSA